MSEIARYFSQRIRKLADDYGIVVWYDPDGIYSELIEKLQLKDIPVVRYQDSFLAIRHQIEPFLEKNERPRLLIYVPMERLQTAYALIEAEAAGCYVMPGHSSTEFDTSLEHVTFQVLKDIAPGNLEDILRKVQQKELILADIDRIASSGYTRTTGTLKLIFDHSDPVEILVDFLAHLQKDDDIRRKNAISDIQSLLQQQLGVQLKANEDIENLRAQLWRLVLINEFLLTTNKFDSVPEQLSRILLVQSDAARQVITKITQFLRERSPIRDTYQQWADRVEKEFSIQNINFPPSTLQGTETFSVVEEKLIHYALQQYLKKPNQQLSALIEQRRTTFWGNSPPYNIVWDWLKKATELWQIGESILKDLQKYKFSVDKLIHKYIDEEKGWYRLDQRFHEFEISFHKLESDFITESELFEKVWVKGRQRYSAVLRELAERFQEVFLQSELDSKTILVQREIFSQRIAPALKEGQKVAYLLVDALRFEMGTKLKQLLQDKVDMDLRPALGQLPGITMVGMGALLPGAENFMAISTNKKGDLGIVINDRFLSTRKERIQYLAEHLQGVSFFEIRLDKVRKPTKSVRDKIAEAQFVLVTSQEIDQLGEAIDPGIARQMMDNLLGDLRRAILELLNLGVETIVVTSDHGYLFGEELDPGDKVDAPGGKTIQLHRRVWIGQGGIKHQAYIRLNENQVGLSGELELVFPKGIAGFKSQGGNEVYFHGGISLQEMVIPVLEIHSMEAQTVGGVQVEASMSREEITNRLFVAFV